MKASDYYYDLVGNRKSYRLRYSNKVVAMGAIDPLILPKILRITEVEKEAISYVKSLEDLEKVRISLRKKKDAYDKEKQKFDEVEEETNSLHSAYAEEYLRRKNLFEQQEEKSSSKQKNAEEKEKERTKRDWEELFKKASGTKPPNQENPDELRRKASEERTNNAKKEIEDQRSLLKSLNIRTNKDFRDWMGKNHPDKNPGKEKLCKEVTSAWRTCETNGF